MRVRIFCASVLAGCSALVAAAAPTGLNVIPTTDLTPIKSWIGGIQNSNTSFSDTTFLTTPTPTFQSQIGVTSWLESGIDYAETPDVGDETLVFNAKALLLTEDELKPNAAIGIWNIAPGQSPGYYITFSKTLNYDQEQYERFRAHHRRNRKVLGRRVHVGMMMGDHGVLQPFAGSDLQLTDNMVFQADWVSGAGNALTTGIAYVLPDQVTVLTPVLYFSNDERHFSGVSLSITHQFNL